MPKVVGSKNSEALKEIGDFIGGKTTGIAHKLPGKFACTVKVKSKAPGQPAQQFSISSGDDVWHVKGDNDRYFMTLQGSGIQLTVTDAGATVDYRGLPKDADLTSSRQQNRQLMHSITGMRL